jgi:ubiquinone/menaquinone biosynthesis C-methylase UbiE
LAEAGYTVHLVDPVPRLVAEAARVLKPAGLLFAAAISRCASALDGLARDLSGAVGRKGA